MLRRSLRLLSNGYYDSEGRPIISYKETLYKIFRRRRANFQSGGRGRTRLDTDRDTDRNIDRDIDRNIDRDIDRNIDRDTDRDIDRNIDRDIDRDLRSKRSSTDPSLSKLISKLKKISMFFFLLPLCFGFAFFIPALSSTFLDSESPDPATMKNTDLNLQLEAMAKHLRQLQDELLRLKKWLLPTADTLPNFALVTQGARIVLQLTSESYTKKSGLTFFGLPIWQPVASPKTVIQGHSHLVPGHCWCFAGGRGQLFIALSHRVTVSHVTLTHISKNLSPTGEISSAPKVFSIYGMENVNDEGTMLGTFIYDQDGDQVQTFKLPDHKQGAFAFVKVQVESNWGHPKYTCLYNFKVHGSLAD